MSGLVRAERRFRARRRAERRRTARPLVVAAALATLVAALVWTAYASPLLRLDRVVVRGVTVDSTSRLTVAQVLAAADVPVGRSLVQVAPGPIQARVAALPPVAAVTVRRLWPHRLEIDVRERIPVAMAQAAVGVALVDATGVAFATQAVAPTSQPLLDLRLASPLEPGASPGDPAAAQARAALAVWRSLPGSWRRQVRWVGASSADDVSFGLARGATVVWGSPGQTADKLTTLTALLRHAARTYDVSTPAFAVTSG